MKSGIRNRGKRADGSVKWQGYYTDPADSQRLIYKTFRRKDDAADWVADELAALRTGTHVRPSDKETPFYAVADEWRETWSDLGPKTKGGYESILRAHVLPEFGGRRVGDITPKLVQDYVNRLARGGKAPNTVKRIFTVLRAVMRIAAERRYVVTNPCDAVRLPRKRAKGQARERMLFLTPEEVRALADAMPRPADALAVYVAAYCGLRAGELWGLRRGDVDPLRGTLTVTFALKEIYSTALAEAGADPGELGHVLGEPKSDAAHRTITMPRFVADLMKQHLAVPSPGGNGPEDFVFTVDSGAPVSHSNFYARTFRPAVVGNRKKGIRPALPAAKHALRWHDLRHTCASLSLAISPNLHVVKERLGHEDIRTTINIYGHLLPSVDEALADGLDGLHAAPAARAVSTLLRVPARG